MPRKIDLITQIYEQKAQSLSDSPGNWLAFLHTAANNYKYDFSDQVLITAQRPHATACAPIELWNSRFDRWVNKGAHGIALIDDKSGHLSLHYVFDVSDTNSRHGDEVKLWKIKSGYTADIIEALEAKFGTLQEDSTLENAILSAADNAVADNMADYLSELMDVRNGSFLEEYDELNINVIFRNILKNSVAYMMMVRCGSNVDVFYDIDDFQNIINFNSPECITRLGAATSDIAEMGLREIEQTVIALQNDEKKRNRTFETVPKKVYHEATEKVKERTEQNNDSSIQDQRRLSDSRAGASEAAGGNAGQVRDASPEVFDEPQKGTVSEPESIGQADRASDGNRADSSYTDRYLDDADEENRGRDGEPESDRPDGLGGTDEQHQTLGGGNGSEQPDLQLNLLSVAEQQQHIETKAEADNNAFAFAISQEDIDAVLTRGGIVSGGKFRIYEQFLKKESSADNVRMLRDEYGIGGSYPAIYNRDLDESHDSKGLEISCGTIGKPEAKILLTWNKVEKRIGELIAADRFFSAKDKEEYPKYRKDKEARTERSSISEEFKSVVNDFNDYETQLGNEAVVLNQYYMISVANAFYSGEKKYYARTAEGDFALVTMREALQSIISENTHLTKRADKILAELSTAIALPFEPTYDELNPPPEPEKEYRFSLSDTVYIGTQEYEILAYDDNEVHLFDEAFPIFNKVIPRAEFDEKLKENPLNDRLLHIVEDTPGIEPRSDADVFFVDKDSESVIWMYYNPDSTAGGQYVTNTLTFAEIRDVALDTSDRSEFFETLAEIADQELADVGSLWFDEAEADFTDTPTFTGMTEETMNGLIEATKAPELTPWQEYRNIQKTYGGALVLYQVGNFFEVYGAEAVSAAYMLEMAPTKKNMEGHGTVDMFGFPAFTLDENTEKLRGLGYDVVIAPIEVGKRNDYFFASTKEPVQTVDTNIGDMPIEDYREITASQNGFDSYEDMYNQGVRLGNGSDKEPEPVKPAWENNSKRKTKSFDLHPEVPQAERHNFDLAHNEMKTVGKKERFRRNIMAIQLLKKCEDENRFATPDEQIILSKYVGWGGIVEAFDENNSAWATEYLELNAVLNQDE